MEDRDLLNERDVARLFRVKRQTVQAWRLRGYGPPYIKVSGRMVRYDMADIKKFLKNKKRQKTK